MLDKRHTHGTVGELLFDMEAMKRGYIVSRPLGDHCRYDRILDKHDGKLYRVQIKYYNRNKTGSVIDAHLERYKDLDAVVVIDQQTDTLMWIPAPIPGLISLRLEESKNKQTKNINWFEDYLDW